MRITSERSHLKRLQADSNYMIFWKRQNYGDSRKKNVRGCQGLGWREGCPGRTQGIFRAMKLLCVIP